MRLGAVLLVLSASGCAANGMVGDGTSLSEGMGNGGALVQGVKLPAAGDGYWVPPRWTQRGNIYGTEELVQMIVRVARRVQIEAPGPLLAVGDLSPADGGRSRWHNSHQSGRDVDLLFFYRDAGGNPVRSDGMHPVDADGVTASNLHFDVERNWALIRAMLEEPTIDVQWIFVYEPLELMLLDYARARGEPNGLIAAASYLLHQPSDSARHDDHFHVRIYCPPSDRVLACRDRGLLRWKKKTYKYELTEAPAQPAPRRERARMAAPLHGLGFAFSGSAPPLVWRPPSGL